MSLKPGKRDLDKIASALDQDHETLEDAAKAALHLAWSIYEAKAKWSVVGQIRYSNGPVDADDPRASRILLGPFGTENQAVKAGESLAFSSATREEARWWAVRNHYGTPASWYAERKKIAQQQGAADDDLPLREARTRMRQEFFEANPGAEPPDHLMGSAWDGLDEFQEWLEEHEDACPSCNGSGQIN